MREHTSPVEKVEAEKLAGTSHRNYTGRNHHPVMSHLLQLEEGAVEPPEAHRRIADCLALVVADLATEEDPSGVRQMV